MILELIGQIWLILAALVCYYSARATYREWGYNKPTPQPRENTWRNVRRTQLSRQSKPRGELRERPILRTAEIWSHGEVGLTRSGLTAKSNRVREPAAASGSKE